MFIKPLDTIFFLIATICMIISVMLRNDELVTYIFHTLSAFFWGALVTRMLGKSK